MISSLVAGYAVMVLLIMVVNVVIGIQWANDYSDIITIILFSLMDALIWPVTALTTIIEWIRSRRH